MQINLRYAIVFILLLGLDSAALASSLPTCSNASLQGAFGFILSGKNVEIGEYAIMGRFDADGKGGFKGEGSQTVNGKPARGGFAGTYTLNADCSGTSVLKFNNTGVQDNLDFVLAADGNEIYLIAMGGKTIEYGSAKRLFYQRKAKR
jgi:hypothetical protein